MRISDWSSDVCSSDLTNPTQKEEPMFTARTRRALAGAAGVAVAALALAGCASSNPLEDDNAAGGETGGDDTLDALREDETAYASLDRSEEHTSELQSLMRISYAVFCLTKKTHKDTPDHTTHYITH